MIATGCDFLIYLMLTKGLGFWYVGANVMAAFSGAVVNFLLGRYWAFESTQDAMHRQAFRYALVSGGSLLLNTLGIYLITEYLGIDDFYSKIIVSITIAITWNFGLQKIFVYKKK
ncbi:MAG: GtrA family protein [Bacteroidota bacterium]